MPHGSDSYINNKEGTNIKIIYNNFLEIIFSNVFNLSHIHYYNVPFLGSFQFSCESRHRKPLFPIRKVLTRKLTSQIGCD